MPNLDFGLKGKTALVSGGAGAIGTAVCEGFANAGAKVAAVDIDSGKVEALAAELGQEHAGFVADLTDVAALPELVSKVEAALGPVVILINVAGVILRNKDLFSVTEAEWDSQHNINLKATFFLCQAVASRLVAEGREGAIVNYSSQGWMSGGYGGSVVYNAAKGGVTTLTRGLARAWAPHRIRVNAVAPGLVDTPMLVSPEITQTELEALTQSVPLKRLGQPDDHVGATVFLASRLADYVTGATVNVSGGFLMY